MTYDSNKLFNYLQVQIVVNSYSNRYYFPDTPQIRDKNIIGLEFYSAVSGLTKDANNVDLVNGTDMIQYYLTLVSEGINKVQQLPLTKLINLTSASPTQQGNADGIFSIENMTGVDLSKSYVEATPLFLPTTPLPFSICFGIFYK
jgi:hypothetical protein